MLDLTGRRVLVTGAARGIGAATAVAFSQLGAEVVATDVLPLDETRRTISDHGGTVDTVVGDLTEEGLVDALLERGPYFSLAHVAGVFIPRPEATPQEKFDLVMSINVRATMVLASRMVDHMAKGGDGYIVIVGSLAGRSGGSVASDSLDYATYAASKGAVHSLVRWLSHRAIQSGVKVNGVAPGAVLTPLSATVTFDPSAFPLGRMGHADELGWSIALLGTPAAGFTSGAIVDVNGGVWVG